MDGDPPLNLPPSSMAAEQYQQYPLHQQLHQHQYQMPTPVTAFDFSAQDSMSSFDPTIAALTHMSFVPPPGPSSSLRDDSSLQPPQRQPDCFPPGNNLRDAKRIKVDPETPTLDSMDQWICLDDDADKMGSFEIDYSKRNDLAGQNSTCATAYTMPGLGTGLYVRATAPFREEDFIDDAAFEDQILSEDDEALDTTQLPTGQPLQNVAPQSLPPSEPSDRIIFTPASLPWTGETPRLMRRDLWGAVPRGWSQALSPDEQRQLLEIALNSGQMPGTFIPPNGFGIGFGAGLGGRLPTELERRPSVFETTQQGTSLGAEELPDASLKHPRRLAAARPAPTKRQSAPEIGKPRSADRIAHNDVERKYRTNLKVKIAELRDAVPALQSLPPGTDAEGSGGVQGAPKGTVLTKATEYIQQLEQRNKAIMLEHQQLARRLQAFEALFNSMHSQPDLMPNHSMTLFDPRGFC
ncbi:hypothetical protein CP533_3115 [Ophiocordyceps camponoti-saundersi (nom. inval.)]|nr:hypothetical protein CP533_3115 [Ophiocordyceps camponoti-saundersi (nom. inval.)]